ncbi:unnamed protein product [Miscanthus lutarioriparius]|uniref:Uncharacterized protein n=1 Tax=Miscanthus lutarioriparius TaxID=422564 RepID=A0A811P4N0_9POAL|nr:unnamed protein product [Miscanthus lutarioriparius]
MGLSCMPSLAKVFPKKPSSPSSSSIKDSHDNITKKQQQGVKQDEGKKKKEQRSDLDKAASTTPYFPFHSGQESSSLPILG